MALSVTSLYWAFASQLLLDTGRAGHTITVTVSRCGCWLRCSAYQVVANSNALELVDNKTESLWYIPNSVLLYCRCVRKAGDF